LIHLTVIDGTTAMALICKSSVHHISLRYLTTTQDMSWITIHYYIVFLYHCDSAYLIVITFTLARADMLLRMLMVLLALHYMASQHLRILNLDLWVIENVVIIVDIFDYLNWLILILFLRFR